MARRRGNPNWGKPGAHRANVIPVVTSFEQAVKEFKLTPDQYIRVYSFAASGHAEIKTGKYDPRAPPGSLGVLRIESTL